MRQPLLRNFPLGLLFFSLASACSATELATLTEANWNDFAMAGKEVDRIYGDLVLRNDKIIAVIARDIPTRNANLTVRQVGGCLIDLTLRNNPNDHFVLVQPDIEF